MDPSAVGWEFVGVSFAGRYLPIAQFSANGTEILPSEKNRRLIRRVRMIGTFEVGGTATTISLAMGTALRQASDAQYRALTDTETELWVPGQDSLRAAANGTLAHLFVYIETWRMPESFK